MRININILTEILIKLKCQFADEIYSLYLTEQYSIKKCKSDLDIDELRDFILLLEEKLSLLKYNFYSLEKNCIIEPSRLEKTSLEYFYEKEKFLTKCDRKILEKIL